MHSKGRPIPRGWTITHLETTAWKWTLMKILCTLGSETNEVMWFRRIARGTLLIDIILFDIRQRRFR